MNCFGFRSSNFLGKSAHGIACWPEYHLDNCPGSLKNIALRCAAARPMGHICRAVLSRNRCPSYNHSRSTPGGGERLKPAVLKNEIAVLLSDTKFN